MTGAEQGFLLLTEQLGNPGRKVLTGPQLRILGQRVRTMDKTEKDRDLEERDLLALGYGKEMAQRILALLEEKELLEYYCLQGKKRDCVPLTRVTEAYPGPVREKLGDESPGCLWAKGDLSILQMPKIALVGSRELKEPNREFAEAVGFQAARQGYALVSGNARGADKTAQEACLRAGGKVISVVADQLSGQQARENLLYLSEDGYDMPFSAQRAISRNRCVHALAEKTFIAQCGYQTGGTWDGTVKNLRFGWSSLYCFRDGSAAQILLEQMGVQGIELHQLADLSALETGEIRFF